MSPNRRLKTKKLQICGSTFVATLSGYEVSHYDSFEADLKESFVTKI
jgi:hypothetical protein